MAILVGGAISYERGTPVPGGAPNGDFLHSPASSRLTLLAADRVDPQPYRGTSLIRNSAPLGLYSRNMPRAV